MVASTTTRTADFTRCAVCKIDLKGRFVYIDEETERLLGYTKEELFGKSLPDILDKNSQEKIDSLLSERNHYETFYDTTTITLISREGRPVVARSIVSLNFIAGNPVNFQLILDVEPAAQPVIAVAAASDYEDFLEELLSFESLHDCKAILESLRRFSGACQAALYLTKDNVLEPRSGSCDNSPDEFVFESIPEVTALHERLARTGAEYTFTDEFAVREAVEKEGTAPSEFVTPMKLHGADPYLLRLIYPAEMQPAEGAAAVTRVRLALRLITMLTRSAPPSGDRTDPEVDVKFTVGFLDNLGIGALLIDPDGQTVGYNPALVAMLGDCSPGEQYQDFAGLLEGDDSSPVVERLAAYLSASADEQSNDDLRIPVKLPSGESSVLIASRLSDYQDDHSACVVLMPPVEPGQESAPAGSDCRLWRSVTTALRSSLKNVTGLSEELSHKYRRQLGEGGSARLEKLHQAARVLDLTIDDVVTMLDQKEECEEIQPADLNLLVFAALQDVRRLFPGADVNCDLEQLPAIQTCRNRLTIILRNLMSNCVKFSSRGKAQIIVTASINDGLCRINVTDTGIGIEPRHCSRIFDFLFRVAGDEQATPPGSGMGLAITRELVKTLGGTITVSSEIGQGTTVTVTLPADPC